MWIPAHVGIEREMRKLIDWHKKEHIDIEIKLSKSEGKNLVWKKVMEIWQYQWDQESKGTHLYRIQNKVGIVREMSNRRKEQIMITRLRIGHSKLNVTLCILGKHPTGLCNECHEEETVSHILMSCRKFTQERQELKHNLQEIGIGQYSVKIY